MKPVWEEVESGMNRAPVPGGWIVQQYDQRYNEKMERWDWQMVGAFFVPDETHAWDITANVADQTPRPTEAVGATAESALLAGAAPDGNADGIRHTDRAPRPVSKVRSGHEPSAGSGCAGATGSALDSGKA